MAPEVIVWKGPASARQLMKAVKAKRNVELRLSPEAMKRISKTMKQLGLPITNEAMQSPEWRERGRQFVLKSMKKIRNRLIVLGVVGIALSAVPTPATPAFFVGSAGAGSLAVGVGGAVSLAAGAAASATVWIPVIEALAGILAIIPAWAWTALLLGGGSTLAFCLIWGTIASDKVIVKTNGVSLEFEKNKTPVATPA